MGGAGLQACIRAAEKLALALDIAQELSIMGGAGLQACIRAAEKLGFSPRYSPGVIHYGWSRLTCVSA
jgi:hypothetical protein